LRKRSSSERSGEAGTGAAVARLEILAYAPTEMFHCLHCEAVWGHLGLGQAIHEEQRQSLLPPDLGEEYERISDWVAGALDRHPGRLEVRLVDAASVEGVGKALRHRLRRFPAFVVNGRRTVVGFDPTRLEAAVSEALHEHAGDGGAKPPSRLLTGRRAGSRFDSREGGEHG
jgi:hypothetical protein